ncbi:thiamine pyrophosphate-binding protein [Clostridium frigoris]|uniref:Thiamine pyrophosphate-binding protein n=1 Tax=Clostridium frigoris TaxID=205327 RepID=A0ABS6BSC5_9CLOT|nr:thiamine pyrophosphate-binding protein [Clostridium frigoris]MBU3159821.1 thiamine pyrophosphate-binding protein [Clostridium frigoris]
MKLSTCITKFLERNGVEYVFGISAGTCSSLWDSLNDTTIKPIITKNEAGALYSATNYADASEKLGVAILGGAVGLNNAINGIADASRRKLPVLIISGYVNRHQIGKGAIQELNTEYIVKPITKYSRTVINPDEVLKAIKEALVIALTPPYGPVHISIPIDVQMSLVSDIMANEFIDSSFVDKTRLLDIESLNYTKQLLLEAVDLINASQTGLILVGRGCNNLGAYVMALSDKLDWPIVTTPEGKGIIPTSFKNNLGSYGFSGSDLGVNYIENNKIDCVLILGTSLGESATRNYNDVLIKGSKSIHIDWDKSELNKVFNVDLAVIYSLKEALALLRSNCYKKNNRSIDNSILNSPYIDKSHTGLSTRLFLEKLPDLLPEKYHLLSDVGEYMNFVFKYLPIKEKSEFSISLNYGAMGVAIGGAIGTSLAHKNITTAVVVGDGAFFMNGSEILVAKEYKLPIIYFVINNSMLGYVEHGHKYLFGRPLEGLIQERVSIKAIAEAMGIKSIAVTSVEELDTYKKLIKTTAGPLVVELITDGSESPAVADRFKSLNNEK